MSRGLTWLCGVALACRPVSQLPLDTTLPDGEPLAAAPPVDILKKLAEDTDPETRALALTGLVGAPAQSEARAGWVDRGLYDPDPWVQRAMLVVGLGDATLDAYAVRASADAATRASIAFDRMAHGATFPIDAFAWAPDTARPDRVPLGLVRVALGDDGAKAVVEEAIDRGDLRDDALLLATLAAHGWPGLAAALERGERWGEAGSVARLQLVRAQLGDAAARAAWRGAVRADPSIGWDLLELIEALPDASRAALARDLASVGDKPLRDALAVVARPTAASVRHAVESGDPTARDLGLGRVGQLGDADAVALIRGILRVDDPWTWVSASRATLALDLCALQDTFATRLQDDRSQVRAAAAGVVARCERGTTP